MTRQVPPNDPRVLQVIHRLHPDAVLTARVDDNGTLHLETTHEYYQVTPANQTDTSPALTGQGATTLPSRGHKQPARLGEPAPASQPPTGDSDPPPGPESPPNPTLPPSGGDQRGGEPDDFTVIPGVGPVTAQKLHDAHFHTYDDLRTTPGVLNDLVGTHTAGKIRTWLKEHLS